MYSRRIDHLLAGIATVALALVCVVQAQNLWRRAHVAAACGNGSLSGWSLAPGVFEGELNDRTFPDDGWRLGQWFSFENNAAPRARLKLSITGVEPTEENVARFSGTLRVESSDGHRKYWDHRIFGKYNGYELTFTTYRSDAPDPAGPKQDGTSSASAGLDGISAGMDKALEAVEKAQEVLSEQMTSMGDMQPGSRWFGNAPDRIEFRAAVTDVCQFAGSFRAPMGNLKAHLAHPDEIKSPDDEGDFELIDWNARAGNNG